jgi:hypothetical protein
MNIVGQQESGVMGQKLHHLLNSLTSGGDPPSRKMWDINKL